MVSWGEVCEWEVKGFIRWTGGEGDSRDVQKCVGHIF